MFKKAFTLFLYDPIGTKNALFSSRQDSIDYVKQTRNYRLIGLTASFICTVLLGMNLEIEDNPYFGAFLVGFAFILINFLQSVLMFISLETLALLAVSFSDSDWNDLKETLKNKKENK